jgi:protein subunit release factor B
MKETIYLEIHEAEGGRDSKLLVEEMNKIYSKVCQKNSFKFETAD